MTKRSFKETFIGDEIQTLNSKSLLNILRVALAELLGTAMLVGLGCMGTTTLTGEVSHLNVVFSFAFAIAVSVMIFGHISGSHINPALSLVGVVMSKISIQMFVVYTVAQCIGATLGYCITTSLFPKDLLGKNFCCTAPSSKINISQAFSAELFLTAIIAMVLCAAWDNRCLDKHDSLPLKFGFAVVALAVPGAQFAGASLNPARTFGPALVNGNFEHHWLYWIAPLTGAFIGSVIYRIAFYESPVEYSPVSTKSDTNHESIKLQPEDA